MPRTRTAQLAQPAHICFTAILSLSFLTTLVSGVFLGSFKALQALHHGSAIVFIALLGTYMWVSRRNIRKALRGVLEQRCNRAERQLPLFFLIIGCSVTSAVLMLAGYDGIASFHQAVGLLFGVCGIFYIINYFGAK